MKTLTYRNQSLIALIFTLFFLSGAAFAGGDKEAKVDKTTAKARQTVADATPDDWYALAKAADMCIKKDKNLKEAASWLDESISIKETPYNLEVKGRYYEASNLPQKALGHYVKALQLGKSQDFYFDGKELQTKINDLHAQLN